MRDILKNFIKFDNFLKMQILIIACISFNWSLIIPLITKLQGLLWATSMISVYLILQKAMAFIYPYFQSLKINKAYALLIILDIIYTGSLSIFFINIEIFLYVEGILMLLYGIMINVFGINYDTYLMKSYDSETFKSLQYIERMAMALAGIMGFFVVILIDLITHDMNQIVITFIVISAIVVIIQIVNYKRFWRNLDE